MNLAAFEFKTPWARLAYRRIASGRITEPQLRKMRIIIAGAINRGDSASCTREEAEALLTMAESMPTQVDAAQARKGADWLHRLAFTKAGEQRQTAHAREFTPRDLEILRDCHAQALPRFTLRGFEDSREWKRWCTLTPIYRCHGARGFFDYVASAWQSGGKFYIVGRGEE